MVIIMSDFYDGAKLLSLTDINGKTPEIYICTSNRNAGKTTYFARMCVNRFKKYNKKFMIVNRFNYELGDSANKFFRDIKTLFFNSDDMTFKSKAKGKYHELYFNNKPCGYSIALNDSEFIKKNSHLFSDTCTMFFDEFQSESNRYCDKEVEKFISIHTSIARGQGKQIRYLPVYMVGNPISIINPYFVALGISDRLSKNTKFMRGDGFVFEQGFNKSASLKQELSPFNRAFSNNNYVQYSSQAIYLNDNSAFIEKPLGKFKYLATLKYMNNEYAIKEFQDSGIVYCDDKPDKTYRYKISVTTDDHQINYVMLKNNDFFITSLRYFFEKGCFRFKNLKCKEAILKALSY